MKMELGSWAHPNGVQFGVWAPYADSVSVVGPFNDWDEHANPCARDERGNWFVDVASARVGDEYRYILHHQGQRLSRIDPRARDVTNSIGNGVVANPEFDWGDDDFQLPHWNKLVIYELHLGTFASKNGAIGTFDDAIERLPYLKSLGINAIEIMPLAEFAGDYSWGYNPAHPFAVESAYGGPDGLKRFVKKSHEHGIGIIGDVVYNHFGPSDLSMWQFDGWSENGKGGIYFYNDWRSSTPWGDTRPDYGRGEVRQYIFDNAMMWLDEYRFDGLRYDMTLYMRSLNGDEAIVLPDGFSLAQWINREASLRFPHKIMIAEDLRNNESLTENHANGGAHFGSQWAADFVHPVRTSLIEIDDRNRSMHEVCAAITTKYNNDAFRRVIYTESHDEVANGKQRVVSEIDPSDSPNRYAIKRASEQKHKKTDMIDACTASNTSVYFLISLSARLSCSLINLPKVANCTRERGNSQVLSLSQIHGHSFPERLLDDVHGRCPRLHGPTIASTGCLSGIRIGSCQFFHNFEPHLLQSSLQCGASRMIGHSGWS
ncbi:MAG: alpha-amylase family glycosyl hydrolase [Pirellulaceae bacterium]|nr:alpha-amylase family glycosyl hydrolase [Pirellulaceae bacterium]